MAFSVFNFCSNIWNNWKFGCSQFIEQERWEKKAVSITSLTSRLSSPSALSISISERVLGLFFCVKEMWVNTQGFKRDGHFVYASKKIEICKGKYKSICNIPTFFTNHVYVTDPNIIKSVLDHERNNTEETGFFLGGTPTTISQLILGDRSLLAMSSDDHEEFRRLHRAEFANTTRFSGLLEEISLTRAKQWFTQTQVELSSRLPAFVIEAVCRCYLDYEGPYEQIAEAVDTLLRLVGNSKKTEGEGIEYANAFRLIDSCALAVYLKKNDIPLLQKTKDCDLTSFIKIMFFAGQDTTSTLIEFLVLMLGQNDGAEWQELLYKNWQLSGKSLSQFALESDELNNIVTEGLRLHPPSFEQTRYVKRDLIVDDIYVIPAGSQLHLSHLFAQRDFRRWTSDAFVFNPKRHEAAQGSSSLLYPFSSGPTTCLGKKFAIQLVKIFLMTMISRIRWVSTSKIDKLEGNVALKIIPVPQFSISSRDL